MLTIREEEKESTNETVKQQPIARTSVECPRSLEKKCFKEKEIIRYGNL